MKSLYKASGMAMVCVCVFAYCRCFDNVNEPPLKQTSHVPLQPLATEEMNYQPPTDLH